MINIKHFEAFNGKEISAVSKFLKEMNPSESIKLIQILSSVSRAIDRPLSDFNAEYMSSNKARLLQKKEFRDGYLKIYFSVDEGIIDMTLSTKSETSLIRKILKNKGYVNLDSLKRTNLTGEFALTKKYSSLKEGDSVIISDESNCYAGIIYNEKVKDDALDLNIDNTFILTNYSYNSKTPFTLSQYDVLKKKKETGFGRYFQLSNMSERGEVILERVSDNREPAYQKIDDITQSDLDFLRGEWRCTSSLDDLNWTTESFDRIQNTDFCIVIDLDEITKNSTSLNSMKNDRKKRKEDILPRIDDDFYRALNKSKYRSSSNNRETILKQKLVKILTTVASRSSNKGIVDEVIKRFDELSAETLITVIEAISDDRTISRYAREIYNGKYDT